MPYPNLFRLDSETGSPAKARGVSRWASLGTVGLATLSFLTMVLPTAPSSAIELRFNRNRNLFRVCAQELTGAGVRSEVAAAACAAALHPRDISQCVTRINRRTKLAAEDALATCRRVRRPSELATCVVDINSKAPGSALPSVLDHCRRSLLPERFSECVVGLSRALKSPTDRLLTTCIDARYQLGQFSPVQPPTNLPPTNLPIQPIPDPSPSPDMPPAPPVQ